jgi:hypothetical protein
MTIHSSKVDPHGGQYKGLAKPRADAVRRKPVGDNEDTRRLKGLNAEGVAVTKGLLKATGIRNPKTGADANRALQSSRPH